MTNEHGQGDRGRCRWTIRVLSAWMVVFVLCAVTAAQDLEPRAYSPSPVGTNFLGVNFSRSTGSVLFDPSIPVTDVRAHLNSPALGLGHTFGMWGRQALFTAALPYVWGDVEGEVISEMGNQEGRITRSGGADLRMKLSVNLHGSPAETPEEFAKRPHHVYLLGTSLTVQAPTGQYDPTKLINLGTNRWGFKPEVGVSYPWKKFDFDLYGGGWFYTANSAFYPGDSSRKQDPLASLQAHASYTFRQHMWFAVDSTWYGGGAASLNGSPPMDRQSNSRVGATLSFPLSKHQSLKLAYGAGTTARTGTNFDTLSVTWQFVWFGLRP